MIQIGEDWVLVVSVQVAVGASYVAASVGSYDGTRFAGANWQRLAFGAAPYATSLFRDRHGRPCMISWLREAPARPRSHGWAGAHSLVSTLAIDPKRRVVASPHPAVTAQRRVHAPVKPLVLARARRPGGRPAHGRPI